MVLRAKKPEYSDKRLKVLFFGSAGVGKTMCAIDFPSPYFIDTEKGTENKSYVDRMHGNDVAVFRSSSFDEVFKEVKSLLTEKHIYKTLVIDSLTVVFNQLVDEIEDDIGTGYNKHIFKANKMMRRLMNILFRLDMNVVVTAHAKNEYVNDKLLGKTFDCYKEIEHSLDMSIEVKGNGGKSTGIVRKTRVDGFTRGDSFDFTYTEIARRYGEGSLDKECKPESIASKEQVHELKSLLHSCNVSDEMVANILKRGGAEMIEDLAEDKASKWIKSLIAKIETKK